MDLITDDHVLLKILEYVCTDYSNYKNSWIETCKLQLVCKRWRNLINYLKNSSNFICNDVRRKICKGILEWHDIFELQIEDCRCQSLFTTSTLRKLRKNDKWLFSTMTDKFGRLCKIYYLPCEYEVADLMPDYYDAWIKKFGDPKWNWHHDIYGTSYEIIQQPINLWNHIYTNGYQYKSRNGYTFTHEYIYNHHHDDKMKRCTMIEFKFTTIYNKITPHEIKEHKIAKAWDPFHTG